MWSISSSTRRVPRVDVRSLKQAGQKSRPPIRDVGDRQPRAHGDETGQVLVLRSHAVQEPGAEAGPGEPLVPRIHQPHRLLVVGRVAIHRADHADIVGVLGRLIEDFGEFEAAFPITLEPKRRAESGPGRPFSAQVARGDFAAGVLREERLRIERVDLRRPAVEIDVDDVLGLAGKVRALSRLRIRALGTARPPIPNAPASPKHADQAQHAQSGAGAGQNFATRQRIGERCGQKDS